MAKKNEERKCFVAVYGTLRRGYGNFDKFLRDQSDYLGKYRIHGFELWADFIPYAIHTGRPYQTIIVEVYAVPEATLELLDRLENVPYHYERMELLDAKIKINKRRKIYCEKVWIYVSSKSRVKSVKKYNEKIESGDYEDVARKVGAL